MRQPASEETHASAIRPTHDGPGWSTGVALAIMGGAVAGLAVMSELMVGSLNVVTETFGLSELFVGVIIVPLIGNVAEHTVAEHTVAEQVVVKNQMDSSLSIALGSSLQIALFVALLRVFISL